LKLLVVELCQSGEGGGQQPSHAEELGSALKGLSSQLAALSQPSLGSSVSPQVVQEGVTHLVGRLTEALGKLPEGASQASALLEQLKERLSTLANLQLTLSPETLKQLTEEIGCELKGILADLANSAPARAVTELVGELTKLATPLLTALPQLGSQLTAAVGSLGQALGGLFDQLIPALSNSPLGQLTAELSEPLGNLVAPIVALIGVRCLDTSIVDLCLNTGAEGLAGLICPAQRQASSPTPPQPKEERPATPPANPATTPSNPTPTTTATTPPPPSQSSTPAQSQTKPSSEKARKEKKGRKRRKGHHRRRPHRHANGHHRGRRGHHHGRRGHHHGRRGHHKAARRRSHRHRQRR